MWPLPRGQPPLPPPGWPLAPACEEAPQEGRGHEAGSQVPSQPGGLGCGVPVRLAETPCPMGRGAAGGGRRGPLQSGLCPEAPAALALISRGLPT